ncbi:DUF7691 family protein [Streptomyces orinoci]|uniref:DUF7691 family protein n=1 Tax=Streptomyces orinoci TaxID=67339 RepID=UPI003BAD9835
MEEDLASRGAFHQLEIPVPHPVDGPHIGMLPLAKARPAADTYRAVHRQELPAIGTVMALAPAGPGRTLSTACRGWPPT